MTGALKYKEMAVRDVMTPLANTFMLNTDEKLSFETIAKIFKTGYSRIPVYEISKVRARRPYNWCCVVALLGVSLNAFDSVSYSRCHSSILL